jgi:enoyl-CoA hydratase
MDYENILVERRDRVGLMRINRPRALNALDGATMRELVDALEALDADERVGCMVIAGNERAFAVGADVNEMADATMVEMLLAGRIELWDRLRGIGKPTVAAVSGWCLGGGCELAMACDMIVASESATFGQPEINLGIIPGAGGTQRLTRAVGKAIAMEMVLGARRLSAAEAYQFGLVSRVVAPEAYLDEALKLADEVASKAPVALRLAKEAVNKAFETTLSEGVAFERRLFYMLFATEDQKEGMDAFINKREPKWQGR